MNLPTVSVVMATYNRSNLLQYSIGSLIRGCYQDWELIVVGDCCTDDTEQVVAQFNDSRIRFVNLETNYGEQTGPNNEGMKLARGQYIAFLNHDDIWLENHLQCNVELLEKTDADLVFSSAFQILPNASDNLVGALTDKVEPYALWMLVPATLWLFKKSLFELVGEWRLSYEIHGVPSQDWLYRAYRKRVKILANPVVTTIIINSGSRINAYLDRQMSEHEHWYKIACDKFTLSQAVSSAFGVYLRNNELISFPLALRRFIGIFARKMMRKFNIWPADLTYWIRFHRKGSYMQYLRRRRGLPPRSPTK